MTFDTKAAKALCEAATSRADELAAEVAHAQALEAARAVVAAHCRCGSGAHPRRCEAHPNAFDAHVFDLNQQTKQDDTIDRLRAALVEACRLFEGATNELAEHEEDPSMMDAHREHLARLRALAEGK